MPPPPPLLLLLLVHSRPPGLAQCQNTLDAPSIRQNCFNCLELNCAGPRTASNLVGEAPVGCIMRRLSP
eukprot:880507-Alexandrium_andersonii.AAC.1